MYASNLVDGDVHLIVCTLHQNPCYPHPTILQTKIFRFFFNNEVFIRIGGIFISAMLNLAIAA